MGLDMHALAVDAAQLKSRKNVDIPPERLKAAWDKSDDNYAYWRGFYALHGWMRLLYLEKGDKPCFNNTSVRVKPLDLDVLEVKLRGREFSADEKEETRRFIERARQWLADGKAVFCSSSW